MKQPRYCTTLISAVRNSAYARLGYLSKSLGVTHGEMIGLLVMMYSTDDLALAWKKYGKRCEIYQKEKLKGDERGSDASESKE